MRQTLIHALFVTIVLTVWVVAQQFACERALQLSQHQPPPATFNLAHAKILPATTPTSQPFDDDLDFGE